MKPAYKYLLIVSLAATLGLGLLRFFANTEPNVEVVLINNSGQPIALIDLQVEKTAQKIRVRGVGVGTEVAVKFHNDGKDRVSTFIRFLDGKEMRGESFSIEPGVRVIKSVTDEKIIAGQDLPVYPDKR